MYSGLHRYSGALVERCRIRQPAVGGTRQCLDGLSVLAAYTLLFHGFSVHIAQKLVNWCRQRSAFQRAEPFTLLGGKGIPACRQLRHFGELSACWRRSMEHRVRVTPSVRRFCLGEISCSVFAA